MPAEPMPAAGQFPHEVASLDEWRRPEMMDLSDGDRFCLRVRPVAKRTGDAKVRMLAYNRSVPGPTLRVPDGTEIDVVVENRGDLETTSTGMAFGSRTAPDGTLETQDAIPVGGSHRGSLQGVHTSSSTRISAPLAFRSGDVYLE